MQLKIISGDITTIACDAIVCFNDRSLSPVDSIAESIHRAAGQGLETIRIQGVAFDTNDCTITDGFDLPCKYIIHTVAPKARNRSLPHKLSLCYKYPIRKAFALGCTSIAFPLFGYENKIVISERQALEVAFDFFEEQISRDSRDMLVHLILPGKELQALAILLAKEKNLPIITDSPDSEVKPMDTRWISLCKVNRPDKNKDIWMQRLADSVNGTLVAPEIDETKDKIFGNRPLIFCEDGPNVPDAIGFWEWTERQNENGRWLSDATYIEQPTPIEIIILEKCSSALEVVESLKCGVHIPAYVRCSVVFAAKNDGVYEGVLCDMSNFNTRPGEDLFITIKNNIYTLPYYELSEHDIFTWKYRKIYKHISLNEPEKIIPIYDLSATIKQMLLQRMNWPVFKAQGISKSDWQKFKQFLSDIPKDSVIERLSEMYSMPQNEAQKCIETFLQNVDDHMDTTDIDSSLIVQILSNHQGLRELCDKVAYKKWCEEHKAEVQKATEETAAIRAAADREVSEVQQQLATVQNMVSSAKLEHKDILAEIATADSKRKQLCADIARYEALGNETIVAVRQKITDAQKDMAGFIADLSVFLPQTQPQAPVEPQKRVSLWQYECAPSGVYSDDEIELSESWNDELNAISQNLAHSMAINGDFGGMLSAFLYATHINKIPLLIVGPSGRELSEIMAVSLYASGAGHLWLGNEPANNIAETVADYDECIVSVQNMFGKGWQDELPQSFSKLKKQVIWTHPYVEDMVIEPKGLLNYMLPILSECFVESIPAGEPWPTRRADTFEAYASTKKQTLKIAAFKKLKLSKLLINRLTIALSDAKTILNQPAKDKDMEVLFGLLPLCIITGRIDVLKETIETESGISSAVKAEANRYIEEE